ncbi:MAG: SPOR domain-containing protein [Gammaproteobacteria bacterium]|jgi:cell division protein FtsN|nr:SPOR domain-containing protein [Gammaproteobacteria bacterium]
MAATRRKKPVKKKTGTPAWMWLLTGVLIGLGLAYFLWAKGYIPQPQVDKTSPGNISNQAAPEDAEEVAPADQDAKKSRYDFFTVLPEMEVIVPEQELEKKRRQQETATAPGSNGSYVLQVGSFRENSDAEEMKARLALLGIMARVQTVTVNDATWHRVRVGPVSGTREADEIRRQLAENDIDSLVMKAQ